MPSIGDISGSGSRPRRVLVTLFGVALFTCPSTISQEIILASTNTKLFVKQYKKTQSHFASQVQINCKSVVQSHLVTL